MTAVEVDDKRTAQVATIMFGVPLLVVQAIVAARLWRWFVTPLGPDPVSVVHAFGLMLIVGLLRPTKKAEDRTPQEAIERIILCAWGLAFEFALGLAAVTVMT